MPYLDPVAPDEIAAGLTAIAAVYPDRFGTGGAPVRFAGGLADNGFALDADGEGWRIRYRRPCDAYRAVGVLLGALIAGTAPPAAERTGFATLGVMLDVSRNAVPRPATVTDLLARYALAGVNQLWLYLEDTYRVPGEPLFGYARGRYSGAELRAIDDAAYRLGIEVVPCVQTLGHLEQVLQWEHYFPYRDTDRVLLAGDDAGYALIGRMLDAVSAHLRSRRIHVGMDEAHGIGTGEYRRRFGATPPFEILRAHLDRVAALCAERGLAPMIWSDMYFRLGSATDHYYDPDTEIPDWVAGSIPAGTRLVYWDYDHTDAGFYGDWIARHRERLGGDPVLAAGSGTHHRMWAQLPRALATIRAGMTAAVHCGLTEAVVTQWGNDGAEADAYSALPAVQAFTDHAYGSVETAANLLGSADATYADWVAASGIDVLPPVPADPDDTRAADWTGNAGKWLLWHDPVLGFLTADPPTGLARHYATLADRLHAAARRRTGDARLAFPALLAATLADKVRLHLELGAAYRTGDVAAVRELATVLLPRLTDRVAALHAAHRNRWYADNSPFGWEVLDRRYGGLTARLAHLDRLLAGWLRDPATELPELAEPPVATYDVGAFRRCLTHARAATPSVVS